MIDEETQSKMALYDYKILRTNKCLSCKKNVPIVLVAQYVYSKDDVSIGAYCKDCFRKEIKEYTLEGSCIVCRDNLDCRMQNLLFSKKEIAEFKKKYWG